MSKLKYTTKPPKKGYVFNESFMTHYSKGYGDKLPSDDTQRKAMELVGDSMREMLQKLSDMGYDETRAGFYIHFKE